MDAKKLDETIARIARARLNIATLGTRNNDRLDIHEVSVWTLRDALTDAYNAGAGSAPKRILDALIGVYTSLQWHVGQRGAVGMDQKRLDDAAVVLQRERPQIFK